MVKLWAGVHTGGVTWHVWHCAWHHDTARDTVRLTRDNNGVTEVAIALSAVSSSPESQKIVEQQREATTSHHKQSESQSQSKTVILCRDPSGRTCLRKQSKKKQRNLDIMCLVKPLWLLAFSSSPICVSSRQRCHHLYQPKIWVSPSPQPFTDLTQKSSSSRLEVRRRRGMY